MKIDATTRGNAVEKTSQGLVQVFRFFYFIALMNDGQDDVLLADFRRYDQCGEATLYFEQFLPQLEETPRFTE